MSMNWNEEMDSATQFLPETTPFFVVEPLGMTSGRLSSRSILGPAARRVLASLVGVTLLLAAACGSREEAPANDGKVEMVSVETAGRATVPEIYEAGGVVQSRTRSTLASRLMGNVLAVKVNEGDAVRRGQLLVEIDGRDLEGQLAQARASVEETEGAIAAAESAVIAAEANADLATKTHERYARLEARNSVSAQELDEVEARWKAARAELDRERLGREQLVSRRAQAKGALAQSEAARSWARITSPIDGIITARLVDPGDQAAPGMPLVEVEDPSSFRVEITVDESRVGRVTAGRTVAVHIDSLERDLTGRVAQIAPALDPSVRGFLVKIDLPGDASSGLRSGLFARAMIPIGEKQAITVPASAIDHRGQLASLFIVDGESVARLRLVSTGRELGDRVEILSGLDDGDRVIVDSPGSVRDGVRVAFGERTEGR